MDGPPRDRDGLVPRLLQAVAVAVLVVAVLGWPHAAQAHTELESSSPRTGEAVMLSRDRLDLVFSDDLLAEAGAVVVRDQRGADVTHGEPSSSGAVLRVRLRLTMPGRHEVSYRVVGADGHVVTGSTWFEAAGKAANAPAGDVTESRDRENQIGTVAPVGESTSGSAPAGLGWLLPAVGIAGLVALIHRRSRARLTPRVRR